MTIRIWLGFALGAALIAAATYPATGMLEAQEASPAAEATPEPTATPAVYPFRALGLSVLAQGEVQLIAGGSVSVRASLLHLIPNTATVPFVATGVTILGIQLGTVTVDADSGVVSDLDIAALAGLKTFEGTPEELDGVEVTVGQQVLLPAGSQATLRNDSADSAYIVIVSVVPLAATGTPTP